MNLNDLMINMKNRRNSERKTLELVGTVTSIDEYNIKVHFNDSFFLYFSKKLAESIIVGQMVACSIIVNGRNDKFIKIEGVVLDG